MVLLVLFLAVQVFAQTPTENPISRERDQLVKSALGVLNKACPGAQAYLCRLQLESDCRKNHQPSCQSLKSIKKFEEQAIKSDQQINSFVKIPFYEEIPGPIKVKIEKITIGTPQPVAKMLHNKNLLAQAQDDYGRLVSLKNNLLKSEVQLQCTKDEDCLALAVGSRPCGGPMDYLIISKLDPQLEKIMAQLELLNFRDSSLQRQLNVGSTCLYMEAPELQCLTGRCGPKLKQ
jgi:hypothetical protein